MTEISIDLGERIATVSRNVSEKHARKLLQDKLKKDTPYKGGWYCYLTNRDGGRWQGINKSTTKNEEDYIFELENLFAEMEGYF